MNICLLTEAMRTKKDNWPNTKDVFATLIKFLLSRLMKVLRVEVTLSMAAHDLRIVPEH